MEQQLALCKGGLYGAIFMRMRSMGHYDNHIRILQYHPLGDGFVHCSVTFSWLQTIPRARTWSFAMNSLIVVSRCAPTAFLHESLGISTLASRMQWKSHVTRADDNLTRSLLVARHVDTVKLRFGTLTDAVFLLGTDNSCHLRLCFGIWISVDTFIWYFPVASGFNTSLT